MLAFTGIQVERITGLTQRQLRYWEKSNVFRASYVDDRPHRPYRRIYSFRDLVSLKTLAKLRNSYGIALQELRLVGEYLRQHSQAPWSELRFMITADRHVLFPHVDSDRWVISAPFGQSVMETILVDDIRQEAEAMAEALRQRTEDEIGQITRHRYTARNQWVIAGTRITTDVIWEFHEAGYSPEAIQGQYPHITIRDIESAIRHERDQRKVA